MAGSRVNVFRLRVGAENVVESVGELLLSVDIEKVSHIWYM